VIWIEQTLSDRIGPQAILATDFGDRIRLYLAVTPYRNQTFNRDQLGALGY